MNINIIQLIIGFLIAVLIAWLGMRAKSLNRSGALGAVLLGTIVFGLGGFGWAVVLMAFFISSSALSKFLSKRKVKLAEKFSKGSQRDIGQVAANGGISGIFVLVWLFTSGADWAWIAFAASLAAANADTWSTELGVLSKGEPVLITTGKKVEKGTSGGVSLSGTMASLAGAMFIALFASWCWPGLQESSFREILMLTGIVSIAGLLGGLVDSFLGATVQAIYHCPHCDKETERYPEHTCGTQTKHIRGWEWLNNDWVNLTCTLSGALFAALAWQLFHYFI